MDLQSTLWITPIHFPMKNHKIPRRSSSSSWQDWRPPWGAARPPAFLKIFHNKNTSQCRAGQRFTQKLENSNTEQGRHVEWICHKPSQSLHQIIDLQTVYNYLTWCWRRHWWDLAVLRLVSYWCWRREPSSYSSFPPTAEGRQRKANVAVSPPPSSCSR